MGRWWILLIFFLFVGQSYACYNIYNITLQGELKEGTLKIKRIQNLDSYETNCEIIEDYLVCNDSFYFYGQNKPYSKPFIFEDYDFKSYLPEEEFEEYLSYSPGEHANKAKEIIEKEKTYMENILTIVVWVKSNIRYSDNFFSIAKTFSEKRGNCESIAVLNVQMLRAVGIPSRVVYGLKGLEQHAWIEVYYPSEEWIKIDPTYGTYGYLGKDYTPISYTKEEYVISPQTYDYTFSVIAQEGCEEFLNKRGNFLYNQNQKILTYKEDDYGSWPQIIKKGYTEFDEINGVGWEETSFDRFIGWLLKLKSFLNKE